MSVTIKSIDKGKAIEVAVTEKLHKEDYEKFVPVIQDAIHEHGKIRLVFDMHDFHGWDVAACWEDMKLGIKVFNQIERIAMVGEKKWEKGMATFCKPFTSAKIRYFDRREKDAAIQWIKAETLVSS